MVNTFIVPILEKMYIGASIILGSLADNNLNDHPQAKMVGSYLYILDKFIYMLI